jgi:hypothetical protein
MNHQVWTEAQGCGDARLSAMDRRHVVLKPAKHDLVQPAQHHLVLYDQDFRHRSSEGWFNPV